MVRDLFHFFPRNLNERKRHVAGCSGHHTTSEVRVGTLRVAHPTDCCRVAERSRRSIGMTGE